MNTYHLGSYYGCAVYYRGDNPQEAKEKLQLNSQFHLADMPANTVHLTDDVYLHGNLSNSVKKLWEIHK